MIFNVIETTIHFSIIDRDRIKEKLPYVPLTPPRGRVSEAQVPDRREGR